MPLIFISSVSGMRKSSIHAFFFFVLKFFFKDYRVPCQIGTFNGDMSTWENGDVMELENAPSVRPVIVGHEEDHMSIPRESYPIIQEAHSGSREAHRRLETCLYQMSTC